MDRIDEKLDSLRDSMASIQSSLAALASGHDAEIENLKRKVEVMESRAWMLVMAFAQSGLALLAAIVLAALKMKGG